MSNLDSEIQKLGTGAAIPTKVKLSKTRPPKERYYTLVDGRYRYLAWKSQSK